jgi:hypothetical protein
MMEAGEWTVFGIDINVLQAKGRMLEARDGNRTKEE